MYRPALLGSGRLHFVQSRSNVDLWRTVALLAQATADVPDDLWEEARWLDDGELHFDGVPPAEAEFGSLPAELTRAKNFTRWRKSLKDHLYQNQTVSLFKCKALKLVSSPDESEADFSVRLRQRAREERDRARILSWGVTGERAWVLSAVPEGTRVDDVKTFTSGWWPVATVYPRAAVRQMSEGWLADLRDEVLRRSDA